MPLGALCDHHRIAKLYEIFTLHGQQLLASFIDLRSVGNAITSKSASATASIAEAAGIAASHRMLPISP
jgi:hypothetical protein